MGLYDDVEQLVEDRLAAQAAAQERVHSALLSLDDVLDAEVEPPRLAPTTRMDLLMPGYNTITGEAGAGKTTFVLSTCVEMALRENIPLIHVDLEMGLASLKQTYGDILSPADITLLRSSNLLYIISKEAFYAGTPKLKKVEEMLEVVQFAADGRKSCIILDGMSEFASWSGNDDNDGSVMRRVISQLSTFAKMTGSVFASFEHLSKEGIKDGAIHSKGSVDKANAADGSVFIKRISPFNHSTEGGIQVGAGAKRLRGGFGSVGLKYYRVGGQGEGNQLIYTPCEMADIPEADSPERDAVMEYLNAHAATREDGRTRKQIGAVAGISEDATVAVLDYLTGRDKIGQFKDGISYRYYALSEAEIAARPSF